jgi:UDP-N-acetylglucosamine 3-dehydrogenase
MKALLVGLGVMGSKHLSALFGNPDVASVTTVDPNNSAANFSSLEKALTDKYDFAVVAVPTSLHEKVAVQLINEEIPVLLEKPIAPSLASAENICNLSEKKNVKVCIGQVERFNPVVETLKERIGKSDIISANFARLGPRPARITDVGVSLDLSVHDLDLVEYLFHKQVVKVDRIISLEHSKYQLKLLSGASIGVDSSWLFPFRRRRIEVLTNEHFYEADLIDKSLYEYTAVDNTCYNMRRVWINNSDALSSQLTSFIGYIKNGEIGNLCHASTSRRVLSWLL